MTGLVITRLSREDATTLRAISAFDHLTVAGNSERKAELRAAASEGRLYVARDGSTPVGYQLDGLDEGDPELLYRTD